jgi:hypothetical protein
MRNLLRCLAGDTDGLDAEFVHAVGQARSKTLDVGQHVPLPELARLVDDIRLRRGLLALPRTNKPAGSVAERVVSQGELRVALGLRAVLDARQAPTSGRYMRRVEGRLEMGVDEFAAADHALDHELLFPSEVT